jgi:hypothetical protein
MNPMLAKLLHFNHQLICPQEGFGAIDMEEWTMLLDMDSERYPSIGDWVTVRHGLYKGDVGYVMSVKNWGQVTLLLVPRLPPPLGLFPLHLGKGNGLAPAPTLACLPWRWC